MKIRNLFKKNEQRNTPIANEKNPIAGKIFTDFFVLNSANGLNNANIQRGVNAISSAIASMKIYEYNVVNGEKKRTNSNINNLLNVSPNNQIDSYTFKQNIILNAFNYGNTLIQINRDLNNSIQSFNLLNSQFINCIYNAIDNTATYYYNGKELDMSDYILFYIYPDKNYGNLFGMSLLSYAYNTLKKSNYIDSFQNNFFNGGSVTGILSPKEPQRAMPPEHAKAAKERFINGSIDGNGLIVLDSDMSYEKISTNAKDSMLLELQEFSIQDLARVLNIPTSYLFAHNAIITEDDRLTFYSETLQPLIERLENQLLIKIYFKKDWNKKLIEFDYENLLKTNKTALSDWYSKMFQLGVFSPNEICQKLGEPLSGEAMANQRFILQNAQPLNYNLNEIKAAEVGLINE